MKDGQIILYGYLHGLIGDKIAWAKLNESLLLINILYKIMLTGIFDNIIRHGSKWILNLNPVSMR